MWENILCISIHVLTRIHGCVFVYVYMDINIKSKKLNNKHSRNVHLEIQIINSEISYE